MKYFLLPFGCQMNLSDSERVRHVIESMGYTEAEKEEDAELLGIIACSVRQKAIDRVYSRIHNWNLRKRKEPVLTFVSGCILDKDYEKFLKLFDLVFRMNQLEELPSLIQTYGVSSPFSISGSNAESVKTLSIDKQTPNALSSEENLNAQNKLWNIQPDYSSTFEAYVPIQNGCDKFCSYCAVPYTRGREVSRPSDEILVEVRNLLEKGYSCITLLGQNVNSYGLDTANRKTGSTELTFPELLERIGSLGTEIAEKSERIIWIYFTSPHPRDMTNDVIDIIAKYPVLAKQIHLPLQSGDDDVLKRMNRKYNLERYNNIVAKIRATLPEATLFTDIIVGFTGETDKQFETTRQAMSEIEFDMAFIAQYSPRPGAASSKWEDDIPQDVKKKRFELLSSTLKEMAAKRNSRRVGKIIPVLITGLDRKPGFYTARTEGRINIRVPGDDPALVGSIVPVKVESSNGLTLFGVRAEITAETKSSAKSLS